jgi:hypothetical protein
MQAVPMTRIKSVRRWPRIGSGTVIVTTLVVVLFALLYFGNTVGWDLTWRSFGVTPLHPLFFDMHAVTDHAACMISLAVSDPARASSFWSFAS